MIALALLFASGASEPWTVRVYRDARPSIVRLTCGGGFGAGFVFLDDRHVATALHVVASGRPVLVTTLAGLEQHGTIVATDEPYDLAIVEVATPLQLKPLLPGEPPPVGAPVAAIGHPLFLGEGDAPHRGLLVWSITAGILSAATEDRLQYDAAVSPGNSGGPLLDVDGRVVGVITSKALPALAAGVGYATATKHLVALSIQIRKQGEFESRWSWSGLSVGMAHVSRSGNGMTGLFLGAGRSRGDWLRVLASLTLLGGGANVDVPPFTGTAYSRIEAAFEGRLRLALSERSAFHPLLELGAGLAWAADGARVAAGLTIDSTCASAACPASVASRTTTVAGWRPLVSVGLRILGVGLSYAYENGGLSAVPDAHRFLLDVPLFGD